MEQLPHEIVDTSLEYEERQYVAAWWANTALTATGQLINHVTKGLARLKRYREGFNATQENIPEKAPVLLRIECDSEDVDKNRFVLYQYIAEGDTSEPPSPSDDSVNVERWQAFGAFVRSFEKLEEDDDFIAEARNLRAFLSEFHVCSYYHDDYYYLVNYDGADNLWKEKNEIWFIKQDD